MILSIALLLSLQASSPPRQYDYDDPPGRVARLSASQGRLSFQPSGDTTTGSWSDIGVNYPLTSGDRLYADRLGRAELQVGDCTVRLGGQTDLTIATLTDDFFQLGLASGTLRVSVYDLSGGDSIEIDTPNGAFLLRDRGAYRVDVSESTGSTTISVESGVAEVFAGEVAQEVRGGSALRLSGTQPIRVSSVPQPRPDLFDRWSAARDASVANSVSAQYVGRDVPGYDDLDRAGRWETVPEYGPVWYPTVAVSWEPYRNGHWAWIDPWGWTWVDDAPWGYVPFHYGRWVYWRGRWAWVPGRIVRRPYYAPALVVFVSFGNDNTQGWFPLGPGEPYRPWYHHGPRYRDRVNPYVTTWSERDVHYVNRPRMTAVPVSVFRGGEPVGRRTVRVSSGDAARAFAIAHPRVQPSPQAAGWTSPLRRPLPGTPRTPRPVIHVTPWRKPPAGGQPGEGVQQIPLPPPITANPDQPQPQQPPPPGEQGGQGGRRGRPDQPGERGQGGQGNQGGQGDQRRGPPPVIARNPPAPAALPFPARERAMEAHPGKPLEPEQRRNLRQGKPAGAPRDTEDLPERRPAPPKKPAPRRP
jgi:uncharacterized protein DUF6600